MYSQIYGWLRIILILMNIITGKLRWVPDGEVFDEFPEDVQDY
jgi:hypothetical protein